MSDNTVAFNLVEPKVETPPEQRTALDEVNDLLAGKSAPASPEPETAPTADAPDPGESWDMKTAAERLGVDPAKLYEQLKVAFDDGTELSVSALKDAYRPVAELEKAREALVSEVTTSRQEVAQATQELANILQKLGPKNLTPEILQEVNRQAEAQKQVEAERLLKALPEWKDPITKAADWSDIRKMANRYGYTDAEMRMAEAGFADHRMVRLLRDLSRAQRPEPPKPQVAAKPTGKGTVPTEAQRLGRISAAVKQGHMTPSQARAELLKGYVT